MPCIVFKKRNLVVFFLNRFLKSQYIYVKPKVHEAMLGASVRRCFFAPAERGNSIAQDGGWACGGWLVGADSGHFGTPFMRN